jgi:hypothetical protein
VLSASISSAKEDKSARDGTETATASIDTAVAIETNGRLLTLILPPSKGLHAIVMRP